MTIDERIQKLAERHEALTQTLELIAIDQREMTKNNQTLNLLVRETTSAIRNLLTIVHHREQRLPKHL